MTARSLKFLAAEYLDFSNDVIYIRSDGSVSIHQNSDRPALNDGALFKYLAQADPGDKKDPQPEALIDRSTIVESSSALEEEKDALRVRRDKGLYRFYLRSVGWVRTVTFLVLMALMVFGERLPRMG